mgnify:CR=1 FL=1
MSKTPEPGQWQRTSPLAVLFFFGKVINLIIKNAWQSLAPLAAFAVAYQGDIVETAAIAGGAMFMLIGAAAILRYWFFRFQLNPDAILIRQGVIKKSQLDIKFDRIQGINTQQNIIYRYLDLVTVSFETAGSAGDEGSLPAVHRELATSLRERIRGPLSGTPAADQRSEAAAPQEPLLTLDWRDIIRIGLSDKRALVLVALIGPLLERAGDSVERKIADLIDSGIREAPEFGILPGALIIVGLVLGVLLLLALASVAAAFWRYHNFELRLDSDTLRSTGGLLTRHEVSMGLDKIQTLRLEQGPILRWFRRFRMTARQARSSHRNDSDKNFAIPVVTGEEASHLRELFMEDEGRDLVQIPESGRFQSISPYYMRSRVIVSTLIPLTLGAVLFPLGRDPAVFLPLLLVAPVIFLIYRTWRHAGYLYTDEGLVRRSGTIGYRTVALLYRKVQRVTVTQSPLQRRKGLATLRVYMASGSVRLPYIRHDLARQLRDYILFKVESNQQAWH